MPIQQVDLVISLAEKVGRLRAQLAEAETELERFVRGGVATTARRGRPPASAIPVAVRVRKALEKGQLTFGEIKEAVLKPGDSVFAVRSALAKDRDRGVIEYNGEKYFLASNGHKKKKAQPPAKGTGPVQSKVD